MAKNLNFNFEEFAVQAIRSIDEIRSYGKDGSNTPIEPRINSFYRAIGLPAAVAQSTTQQDLNNGNIFSPNVLSYEQNSTSFNIRKFAFKREIVQDEVDRFLLFNQNKFNDSIQDVSDPHARPRGVLFPMIVDGEIPIFPQDKRVATAFKIDADLIVGTSKYRRPLIEAIVLMRLKTEGVQNQELQDKITQDFGSQTVQDLSQLTPLIATALINTTDGLDELLAHTVFKANKAKQQTGVNLTPIIANIAQQSLSRIEPADPSLGETDRQKILQEERLKVQQSILASLEYDDTFTGDLKESRNVKSAMLVSNLISVINSGTSPQSKIKKDIKETGVKREKYVSDIKEVFRTLDLLLGTFSGISGVDILVVIAALFKISLNALFGLLNDQSIANLEKIKGQGIAAGRISVISAVEQLEHMVTDIFNQIESNVAQTKHARKRSRQEEGGV